MYSFGIRNVHNERHEAVADSLCKRSTSACLRTEPNTRNPFETSTFVVPQQIPVKTPVTTTSLLFAFATPKLALMGQCLGQCPEDHGCGFPLDDFIERKRPINRHFD